MNLTSFEALSFDCYGTLIDWETGMLAVLGPWARNPGLQLGDEALLERYGAHEARAEQEAPQALYPDILSRSLTAMAEELGAAVSADEARRFGASVPDWPAFPDSPAALASLARRYKLIILSNVDRESFAGSNARLGVTFDAIITAQDLGSYKPSPRNFRALLERAADLGVGEGKLLHVAQSLFHDHVPAKAAGLPTVWINRRGDRSGWGATPRPDADVQPDWEFPTMESFAQACESETRDSE